jgi:predicted acetyltransferase
VIPNQPLFEIAKIAITAKIAKIEEANHYFLFAVSREALKIAVNSRASLSNGSRRSFLTTLMSASNSIQNTVSSALHSRHRSWL